MRYRQCLEVAVVIAALFCLSSSVLRAQAENVPEADSKGIIQAISGYVDGFNQHDPHALSVWFAEDADFVNAQGEVNHGRAAVEQRFVPRFAGNLKTVNRTLSMKSIRLLSPAVALAFATSDATGLKKPDGSDAPPSRSLYEVILTKQGSQWLIANFHESNIH